MKPGFWCEDICEPRDVVTTEAARGLCMAFRRKVFEEERFDENMPGYALKEDVDFGYRVSRRYTIIQTPHARCDHLPAEANRPSAHLVMRVYVGNQVYLHRKNMPQDLKHRVALWWGFLGQFAVLLGRVLREQDPGLVTGFLVGLWDQFLGRGLFDVETRTHAPRWRPYRSLLAR
jgi:GT2 family glycosyltransferase